MNSLHLRRAALKASLLAFIALTPAIAAEAQPDFMSDHAGWQLNDADRANPSTDFHYVPGLPGQPVNYDVKWPYVGNGDIFHRKVQPRVADVNNPILQDWAKAVMKPVNDAVTKNGLVPFTAEQRCWPGGVPGLFLYPAEPVFYLQTKNEVVFMTQRDHQIRRIYLNAQHTPNPGYSWYGESVGHYENGDTLVADTIGLDDKGPVDNYRTPHTKQLHVVESHQVDAGRSRVFVNVTVTDPGAFTMPWHAWKIYAHVNRAGWEESICAENNADYFDEHPVPLPHAMRLDF